MSGESGVRMRTTVNIILALFTTEASQVLWLRTSSTIAVCANFITRRSDANFGQAGLKGWPQQATTIPDTVG